MDWFLYDNGIRHERVKHCKPHNDMYLNLNDKVFIDTSWILKYFPDFFCHEQLKNIACTKSLYCQTTKECSLINREFKIFLLD